MHVHVIILMPKGRAIQIHRKISGSCNWHGELMWSVQGIMHRGARVKRVAVSVWVWGKEGRVWWGDGLWYHRPLGVNKLRPERRRVLLIRVMASWEVVWWIQGPVRQEIRRVFRNHGRGEWFEGNG